MPVVSSFGQRFLFSRDFQRLQGRWTSDGALAGELGLESQSQISAYKAADVVPPAARVLAIAKRTGVDPGWLAFGAETGAPEPAGFAMWLSNQSAGLHVAETEPTYVRVAKEHGGKVHPGSKERPGKPADRVKGVAGSGKRRK
jgi:hypothetical protein